MREKEEEVVEEEDKINPIERCSVFVSSRSCRPAVFSTELIAIIK